MHEKREHDFEEFGLAVPSKFLGFVKACMHIKLFLIDGEEFAKEAWLIPGDRFMGFSV